jgi:hypothetical protein
MSVGPNSPLSNIALERSIVIFFPLCASIIYIYRLVIVLLLNNFAFDVQLRVVLWTTPADVHQSEPFFINKIIVIKVIRASKSNSRETLYIL